MSFVRLDDERGRVLDGEVSTLDQQETAGPQYCMHQLISCLKIVLTKAPSESSFLIESGMTNVWSE